MKRVEVEAGGVLADNTTVSKTFNQSNIEAFMRGLKKLTLETGVALTWTDCGIDLIDVRNQLSSDESECGYYSWVTEDGRTGAHDVQWEYEGEDETSIRIGMEAMT